MNFKNRALFSLSKKIIEKNLKFKDIHKGQSCYLFGNGSSLKYFDFKSFNDKDAIGCGALFLHKDFNLLNIKYYFEGHPFFYYPYWINPYSRKIQMNPMGKFFKKRQLNNNFLLFCNLSNFFGIRGENIYYVHHFDKEFESYSNCKLDGNFTTMSSSLSGMLGLAIYMGYDDITLVGCDYSFAPQSQGHFYENGVFKDINGDDPNKQFLEDSVRFASIQILTPHEKYQGNVLSHVHYKELTGQDPIYKENNKIIEESDLNNLDSFNMSYRIF